MTPISQLPWTASAVLLLVLSAHHTTPAQTITVNPSQISLHGGESITLSASVNGPPFDAGWKLVRDGVDAANRVGGLGIFPDTSDLNRAGGATVRFVAPRVPYPVEGFIQVEDAQQGVAHAATVPIHIEPPTSALPKGKIICTVGGTPMEIDVATGARREIYPRGDNVTCRSGLYLFADVNDQDGGPALYRLNSQGSPEAWLQRAATDFAFDYEYPRISPGGRFVTVYQLGSNSADPEAGGFFWQYVFPNNSVATSEDAHRTFYGFQRANWLPDERLVLVDSHGAGEYENGLYVTDTNLFNPQSIGWNSARYGAPLDVFPSPDGRRLAVVTYDADLYLADFDPRSLTLASVRSVRAATLSSFAFHAAWSPDGHWLAYTYGGRSYPGFEVPGLPASGTLLIVNPDDLDAPAFTLTVDIRGDAANPLFGPVFTTGQYQLSWQDVDSQPRGSIQRLAGGAFRLIVSGTAGSYVIERSSDLQSWEDARAIQVDASGFAISDQPAPPPDRPMQFFRARRCGNASAQAW